MKVVHVCSDITSGGAAHSTLNLHNGLLSLGIDSWILTASSQEAVENVIVFPIDSEWKENANGLEDPLVWHNRGNISNTHFSLNLSGCFIANHQIFEDVDVINLHWVSDFLTNVSIAELATLRKPVVWTLHDMRPLTGGCHFSAGCERFIYECGNCPQLQFDYLNFTKRSLLSMNEATALVQPHFVAPSKWMHQKVLDSRIANDLHSSCIPYGVDIDLFRSGDSLEARKKLGLSHQGQYILLASHSMLEKRKGVDYALRLLEHIKLEDNFKSLIESGDLRLLCCGHNSEEFTPDGWIVDHAGYLKPEEMPYIYQSATIMLFTSLEDNLPNVILEAMSCGLPVVGHAVGGAVDLLEGEHGKDCLFAPGDFVLGTQLITNLLNDSSKRKLISNCLLQKIKKDYTLTQQAEQYLRLYKKNTMTMPEPKDQKIVFENGINEETILESYTYVISLHREIQNYLIEIEKLKNAQQHELYTHQQEVKRLKNIIQSYEIIESNLKIVKKSKWYQLGALLGICQKD